MDHSQTVNFIWNIANLIRDHLRRGKYPDVILPFTVLRRIDLVLTPTKDRVLKTHARFQGRLAPDALDTQLRHASGFGSAGALGRARPAPATDNCSFCNTCWRVASSPARATVGSPPLKCW